MALQATVDKVKPTSRAITPQRGKIYKVLFHTFDSLTRNVKEHVLFVVIPLEFVEPARQSGVRLTALARNYAEHYINKWERDDHPFKEEIFIAPEFIRQEERRQSESTKSDTK